jgi:hypothetical protein
MDRHPIGRRKLWALFTTGLALALITVGLGSDFVIRRFWSRHPMTTSLIASLLVVILSVAVVNDVIDRRSRRRWSLVAQSSLFALTQEARLTWITLLDVLGLEGPQARTWEALTVGVQVALDRQRVSEAAEATLLDRRRRLALQPVLTQLGARYSQVIATWASVMLAAAPYADRLDHHAELQGRLEWLASVMTEREPVPRKHKRRAVPERISVATEKVDEFDETWIHDMLVSITVLAARLDLESHDHAFSLASSDWWIERTRSLTEFS